MNLTNSERIKKSDLRTGNDRSIFGISKSLGRSSSETSNHPPIIKSKDFVKRRSINQNFYRMPFLHFTEICVFVQSAMGWMRNSS